MGKLYYPKSLSIEEDEKSTKIRGKDSKKKERLSDERIVQLKAIGFVFQLKEEKAMKRYQNCLLPRLKEFFSREGHSRVYQSFMNRIPHLVSFMYYRRNEEGISKV